MSNVQSAKGISSVFKQSNVVSRFSQILGDEQKSAAFISNVLNAVQLNDKLQSSTPESVMFAAANAASLGLQVDPNLGWAYLVPYNEKQKDGSYIQKCQFQMGYKGFIQLAIRSGEYLTINTCKVYESDSDSDVHSRLTSMIDLNRPLSKVVGYAAYFKLVNGFEKSLFMTNQELKEHGAKYSKTFNSQYGRWKKDFEAMATKTVLKRLLEKYGPKSIQMQKAQKIDQAIINDWDGENVSYSDNERTQIDSKAISDRKEVERLQEHIETIKDNEDALQALYSEHQDNELFEPIIGDAINELQNSEK
jgi:recombination protein RecT